MGHLTAREGYSHICLPFLTNLSNIIVVDILKNTFCSCKLYNRAYSKMEKKRRKPPPFWSFHQTTHVTWRIIAWLHMWHGGSLLVYTCDMEDHCLSTHVTWRIIACLHMWHGGSLLVYTCDMEDHCLSTHVTWRIIACLHMWHGGSLLVYTCDMEDHCLSKGWTNTGKLPYLSSYGGGDAWNTDIVASNLESSAA